MFGLIAVVVAMAAYYGVALSTTSSVLAKTSSKRAEYDKLVPKEKAAKREEDELTKQLAGADSLSKRIDDRFLWAPVLEQIASSIPLNVQITHMTGEMAADATRKCTMVIEGIAAGETPRKVAEDMRADIEKKLAAKYVPVPVPGGTPDKVAQIATFRSLDDGAEKITFGGKKLDTANFAIIVTFLPKAPPEPVPTAARGAIAGRDGVAKTELAKP
jgi:hypothetical protein